MKSFLQKCMLLICATAISTGINAAAADDGLGEMVKYSIKCTENNDKVIRFERTIKFRPNKHTSFFFGMDR